MKLARGFCSPLPTAKSVRWRLTSLSSRTPRLFFPTRLDVALATARLFEWLGLSGFDYPLVEWSRKDWRACARPFFSLSLLTKKPLFPSQVMESPRSKGMPLGVSGSKIELRPRSLSKRTPAGKMVFVPLLAKGDLRQWFESMEPIGESPMSFKS